MPARNGAGRPAKPTALKLLHGDDKKNPQRVNRAEPQPSADEVVPPWPLSPAAQENWVRLAPDRIRAKVLTAWDVDAFGQFCEALVVAQAAFGAGDPAAIQKAVNVCATLGGRFGWTPSDRAKLVVGEAQGKPGEDLLSA